MDLMDELAIRKKRRSIATRRPRQDPTSTSTSSPRPDQDQDQDPASPPDRQIRKREFLLNAPSPASSHQGSRRASQSAVYRTKRKPRDNDKEKEGPSLAAAATARDDTDSSSRGDSKSKSKVTKLKLKVGGVSRTIHQHKPPLLHEPEPQPQAHPPRKSNRTNKKHRLSLSDEQTPPPYDPPLPDHPSNTKPRKKRLSKDLPSDASTDYESGEEKQPPPLAPHLHHVQAPNTKNLTSRQRAMLKGGKDTARVEFPEGLPPPPSRSKNTKIPLCHKCALLSDALLLLLNCTRICTM